MADPLDKREEELRQRLARIDALEQELKARESARKQVLLRLSSTLWAEIAAWADADFRSINGQIEYILTEAVRRRRKSLSGGDAAVSAPDQGSATPS